MTSCSATTSPKKATTNVVWLSLALTVIASIALFAAGRAKEASSVCIGAAASIISFTILSASIYFIFIKGRVHAAFWGSIAILKLLAVGLLIWYVVTKGLVEPISFLGGISTVIVSLVVQSLAIAAKNKTAEGR